MPLYAPVLANLRVAMSYYARATTDGRLRDESGLTLISSGVRYGVFNAAIPTTPIDDISRFAAMLDAARAWYADLLVPWSCWLCDDLVARPIRSRALDAMRRAGLHETARHPGMIAEALRPQRRPLPELEIRRVGDAVTRRGFCEVTSVAFHVPLRVAGQVYGGEGLWQGSGFRGAVGYAEGAPVSTIAIATTGGTVGVYSVATLPSHQRRGYAEVMMRHALAGAGRSVLQTTEAGRALYNRLGYRRVTDITVYLAG
jgi:ribosomal protein S18 acetylase RimI-like enzyme